MSDYEKSAVPILDIRKCRVYTLENWKSKRFKVFAQINSVHLLQWSKRLYRLSFQWLAQMGERKLLLSWENPFPSRE